MRRFFVCLLVTLAMGQEPAQAESGMSHACRVPDIFLTFDSDLKRTERLVDRSAPVRILLLGPAAQRQAMSDRKRTRLETELSRRLPDIRFTVINWGSARGLVQDDFERLRAAVEQETPDLVVWQVGTGDALAATDAEAFSRTLEEAADWLKARGIDLVLIDPPFVAGTPHEHLYRRIVSEMDVLSDREHMNVVQQYGATSYLFASPQSGSRGTDGRLCLPELLAEAIVRAVTR